MQQRYQDAMAVVRKFGTPDLFITDTCNPYDPEIIENLGPNQSVENRPDLVVRVFHAKLQELIKDITVNRIYGDITAWCGAIEFQKRGLPHFHGLFILDKDSKIRNRSDIDKIIKAEIPDESSNPRLYNIIKKTMIHGPCGNLNKNAVCMEDNNCIKGRRLIFKIKML